MCECSDSFLDALHNKRSGISDVDYTNTGAEIDDAVAIDIFKDGIRCTLNNDGNRSS
jgi:hypothetical protein